MNAFSVCDSASLKPRRSNREPALNEAATTLGEKE
jgi:hypothetical protein